MVPFLVQNQVLFQFLALVILVICAFWKGGAPERILACTMFMMVVVDQGYHAMFGFASDLSAVDLWHMALDTVVLAAMMWVALLSNRFYPLVLAAAQVVAFTAHLVRALIEPISSLSYYLLYATPSLFQMLFLAIGLIRHTARLREHGPYPDWRPGRANSSRLRYS